MMNRLEIVKAKYKEGPASKMKLLKRSGTPAAEVVPEDLIRHTDELKERSEMLMRSVDVMLRFLKAFALDIEEIQSDRYKEEVETLTERFQSEERTKRLELHFERQKERILTFIERQKGYVQDRETELRDIIDLLTKAMANLNIENIEFYHRIHEQGEKIIEISGLDDIKKIKNALKVEVEQMWEMVELKQDQEKRQIQSLANQVHTLQTELEVAKKRSMTDGLTGIYNRHALDLYLDERIERNRMVHNDFCLLMVDIDNFKQINDKYGHQIGDRVLVALAQKCRGAIRGDDFLARYGGEEFTIILEGASFRNALKKGRSICTNIASVRYATSDVQSEDFLSMTVSIGMSQYKKGDTPEELIARADKALYEAKRKGKNCVVGKKS